MNPERFGTLEHVFGKECYGVGINVQYNGRIIMDGYHGKSKRKGQVFRNKVAKRDLRLSTEPGHEVKYHESALQAPDC